MSEKEMKKHYKEKLEEARQFIRQIIEEKKSLKRKAERDKIKWPTT